MAKVAALIINLGVPLVLILLFQQLQVRMREARIAPPPLLPLAASFISYGNWLVTLLTALFLRGGVIQGVMFMVLVSFSVLAMPACAFLAYRDRDRSKWHRSLFWICASYLAIGPLLGWITVIIRNSRDL